MSGPLQSPERVLPTLNADGSRNRIRPKLYPGRYYRARRLVAWALIVGFVAIPFLRIGGKPLILLDIPARQFHLFGTTFLSTDGVLLMLLALTVLVGIIWITALVGRGWCGWACPQTVYMEFLFRPIERWFEGPRGQQLRLDEHGPNLRRVLKNIVFAGISVLLGNVFLAYFVGVDRLAMWVRQSPFDQPTPFIVMAATAALVFFDFANFREQMCTVICPYARIQAVLLDKSSLIIGYDEHRGEPRHRGRQKATDGDCVDCNSCVVACPTGIDIRQGLQLECVACAQCVDACDSVMERLNLPRGLVRYGSQTVLESPTPIKNKVLRWRLVLYSCVFAVFAAALIVALFGQRSAEVTILRGLAAPYVLQGDQVQNQIRIKVENRGDAAAKYHIELRGAHGAQLIAPINPLSVAAGTHETTTVFVLVPRPLFQDGKREVSFHVSGTDGFEDDRPYRLLGPLPGEGGQIR